MDVLSPIFDIKIVSGNIPEIVIDTEKHQFKPIFDFQILNQFIGDTVIERKSELAWAFKRLR